MTTHAARRLPGETQVPFAVVYLSTRGGLVDHDRYVRRGASPGEANPWTHSFAPERDASVERFADEAAGKAWINARRVALGKASCRVRGTRGPVEL